MMPDSGGQKAENSLDTQIEACLQVDLGRRKVRTLAGNGQQGRDYQGGGSGRSQQLSSPWDMALDSQACTACMYCI